MPIVVEVKFSENGRVYYFDASSFLDLKKGENVIVDADGCNEFAVVLKKPKEVPKSNLKGELKSVIRRATKQDLETHNNWLKKEKDAVPLIEKSVQKFNLDMKLVDVKYNFDGSKILIIYTADGRVDFRELVRELASIFKTRVELRQIGSRDEAKMCGGCGVCGQELCCRRFLDDYNQSTIKMAKAQGLALNPSKINGVCGKLMCCLEYEYPEYKKVQDKMPALNSKVTFEGGEGIVVFQDLLKEQVVLKVEKEDASEFKTFDLDQIKFVK